jgi:hypothetical protein
MRLVTSEPNLEEFDVLLALREAQAEWQEDADRRFDLDDFSYRLDSFWQFIQQLDSDALLDRADPKYQPPNYLAYLQSKEWKARAWRCKNTAAYRCRLCDRAGRLHAHHRTYVNLGRELPSDLLALCRGCHKRHHNK